MQLTGFGSHQKEVTIKMDDLSQVGAQGLMAGASLLSRSAEEFDNDPAVEQMWAMKAFEHAEVYFNILCSVDPQILRLTPSDDEIYHLFRREFPDMKINIIDEEKMKCPSGKEKWRCFCELFKDKVEDYSFGTLLRINCCEEYSEKNAILVPRIQFYAIELARNKEGYNNLLRIKFQPSKFEKS